MTRAAAILQAVLVEVHRDLVDHGVRIVDVRNFRLFPATGA